MSDDAENELPKHGNAERALKADDKWAIEKLSGGWTNEQLTDGFLDRWKKREREASKKRRKRAALRDAQSPRDPKALRRPFGIAEQHRREAPAIAQRLSCSETDAIRLQKAIYRMRVMTNQNYWRVEKWTLGKILLQAAEAEAMAELQRMGCQRTVKYCFWYAKGRRTEWPADQLPSARLAREKAWRQDGPTIRRDAAVAKLTRARKLIDEALAYTVEMTGGASTEHVRGCIGPLDAAVERLMKDSYKLQ